MEYWWCRKPDCCGAQAVRRRRQRAEEKRISLFAAPEGKDEGLSVMKGSLIYEAASIGKWGKLAPAVMSLRKEGGTVASRTKAVEPMDFFAGSSANRP